MPQQLVQRRSPPPPLIGTVPFANGVRQSYWVGKEKTSTSHKYRNFLCGGLCRVEGRGGGMQHQRDHHRLQLPSCSGRRGFSCGLLLIAARIYLDAPPVTSPTSNWKPCIGHVTLASEWCRLKPDIRMIPIWPAKGDRLT